MKNYFFAMIALLSCSAKREEDKNIELIIQYAQSDKYDLKNGVYTVFYTSKAPLEIKFTLSNEEKNKIINEYYSLNLDEIPETLFVEDECMIMPKLFTELHIKSKNKQQVIKIDEDCDDFSASDKLKAHSIKKYLKVINSILEAKPEIKNAPKSDILYM